MRGLLPLALMACSIVLICHDCRGEGDGLLAARRGPWIVYRYPLFREGNRPPEARRHSQDYYWPYDAYERYPKFYGGLHARRFQELGWPPGDIGLRGTAW